MDVGNILNSNSNDLRLHPQSDSIAKLKRASRIHRFYCPYTFQVGCCLLYRVKFAPTVGRVSNKPNYLEELVNKVLIMSNEIDSSSTYKHIKNSMYDFARIRRRQIPTNEIIKKGARAYSALNML